MTALGKSQSARAIIDWEERAKVLSGAVEVEFARAEIPVDRYVEALEFRQGLAPETVLFIRQDEDSYAAIGEGAEAAARALSADLGFRSCLGRTVPVMRVPCAFMDAAMGALRRAGFGVAVGEVLAECDERRVALVRNMEARQGEKDRADRIREAIADLPDRERRICEAFGKLRTGDQRYAEKAICRWLRVIAREAAREAVNPTAWRKAVRPTLPDSHDVAELAAVMSEFNWDNQRRVLKMVSRFKQALDAMEDSEVDGEVEGDSDED